MKSTEKPCKVCTDFKSFAIEQQTTPANSSNHTRIECPPDSNELGRATWTFLHTMAAYYPPNPSLQEQAAMRHFIRSLSRFYPCQVCADHLKEYVGRNPIKATSDVTLSQWFCELHNEVNKELGKKEFDCERVLERWRDGC